MEEAKMSFENQWSAAFEGAEMTPSEHVWTSIDGVLANQQASGFKKRVLFFKWVAAASVSIAILAVSALWIQNSNEEIVLSENQVDNEVVTTRENINQVSKQSENLNNNQTPMVDNFNQNVDAEGIDQNSWKENNLITQSQNGSIATKVKLNGNTLLLSNDESAKPKSPDVLIRETREEKLYQSSLSAIVSKDISSNTSVLPDKPETLYKVVDPYALKNFKVKKDEFSLWAGVSMSAGSFNPNASGGSPDVEALASLDASFGEDVTSLSEILNDETLKTGSSISAGLDVRGKISEKFIISSGIHYLKNSSSVGSSVIVSDAGSGDSFAIRNSDLGDAELQNGLSNGTLTAQSSNSNFDNGLQYISVPFKAGYVILDRKINIVLNSGVATNFLIDAQLNGSDGQTRLFNQNNSFSQEFKPIYFNFLSSLELGYTFGEKYFFSIEPSYSKAFTDFTQSESSFAGRPNNFGVSIGLKYNF